jgi:hypothetical protein
VVLQGVSVTITTFGKFVQTLFKKQERPFSLWLSKQSL